MVIQQRHSSFVSLAEAPNGGQTSLRADLTEVSPEAVPLKQAPRRRDWERRYTGHVRITDIVIVCGVVLLAQFVRFGGTSVAEMALGQYQTAYSAGLVVIWLAALAGFRTRSSKYMAAGIEEYRRVVAASFWTFGVVAIAELL